MIDSDGLNMREMTGGKGGIRTHGTFPYTRFPSVLLKPLGHLSINERLLMLSLLDF